jgi:8-oxo-dGTP pyrophosphatase MutT (NUDIX family)
MTFLYNGADDRTRTGDLRFTKALLYQLSYIGVSPSIRANRIAAPTKGSQGEFRMIRKVQVWLIRGESLDHLEVLLLRTIQNRGSFWQPITGGIEAREVPLDSAIREVHEETGVRAHPAAVKALNYRFEFQGRWGRAQEEVFFIRVKASDFTNAEMIPELDPNEHDQFCWVSLSQAISLLSHEEIKKCLNQLKSFLKKNFEREN